MKHTVFKEKNLLEFFDFTGRDFIYYFERMEDFDLRLEDKNLNVSKIFEKDIDSVDSMFGAIRFNQKEIAFWHGFSEINSDFNQKTLLKINTMRTEEKMMLENAYGETITVGDTLEDIGHVINSDVAHTQKLCGEDGELNGLTAIAYKLEGLENPKEFGISIILDEDDKVVNIFASRYEKAKIGW
jgi:hypothetical protein